MRDRGTKNRGTRLFSARGTKTVQNRGTKNRGTRLFLRPILGYKNEQNVGRGYKKRLSCTPRNRSGVQKTGFLYPSKSVGGTKNGFLVPLEIGRGYGRGGYKENQGYTKIGRGGYKRDF